MKKTCISKEWFFSDFNQEFQKIDLPYDFAIRKPRNKHREHGASNGYFDGGRGVYIKYIRFDESRHIMLDVDGAYMCAAVKLNEDFLGMHPHGYTPFLVDLSEKVVHDKLNKIEISTTEQMPSTRWYSGAGIYRDVFLWTGGQIRIEPRDLFVKTISASENEAEIKILYDISSDVAQKADIEFTISFENQEVVTFTETADVTQNKKVHFEKSVIVKNPKLWSIGHGNLYDLKVVIKTDKEVLDVTDQKFGIREIKISHENGLEINGKTVKLRGGCIHHDHAGLGASAFPAAEERKVKKLVEAGFNALRIAHNPPSTALMEVCDKEGVVLLDEAFDSWNVPKAPSSYNLFFMDWWERDIEFMVTRDRIHPSIFTYSIGNEIPESDGQSDGYAWSKKLSDKVREFDDSRPVLSAVCGFWDVTRSCDPEEYRKEFLSKYKEFHEDKEQQIWDEKTEKFFEPLDIAGYNYLFGRYEKDGKKHPKRIIIGTETHALDFYKSWHETMRLGYVLGDFTWTAYDNLGEVGTGRFLWSDEGVIHGISTAEYPWRSCYQGDLDLCGYRRPQSYFREAVWIGNNEPRIFTTDPKHNNETFSGTHWHWYDVHENWTFDDKYIGEPVTAEVYTDADEIIFELNGKEAGRAKPVEAIAKVQIPYEKGVLVAKAVKNGKIIKTSSLKTVGKAEKISIIPEKEVFQADNRDLCYFDITVTDASGNRVPDSFSELTAIVEGGELMCIFSGDPKNEDNYTSSVCHAFYGRAVAVVRADKEGIVKISVGGTRLKTATAEVKAI